MGFSQFSQFRSQSGFSLDWVFFSPYLCTGIQGNEAVSVAPASPGKHLAARLVTPIRCSLPIKHVTTMEAKNIFSNTELSVNLKTMLRTDRAMQTGRDYLGVLRRDSNSEIDDYLFRDPHYTFIEALPWTLKRNPCVYRGRLITVTRRDDGSLRLNFKPLRLNDGFTVDGYALEVAGEIREALKGLVGE